MVRIVLRTLALAVVGMVLAPIATMIAVLALSYMLDPRCGTPGDSGGCEMGAASVALMAIPVGLILGSGLGIVIELRARARTGDDAA